MPPSFTHPSARVHRLALIGDPPEARGFDGAGIPPIVDQFARIEAFATVDAGKERPTRIGARSWLFKHSHVGHDAEIGQDCEVSTGAVIGGYAVLEDGARVGLQAVVRPRVRIGARARIGMGAVVTKDVPAGAVMVGNPAREITDFAEREASLRELIEDFSERREMIAEAAERTRCVA